MKIQKKIAIKYKYDTFNDRPSRKNIIMKFTKLLPFVCMLMFLANPMFAEIKKVQKQLNEMGYQAGPADGLWGNKTENAVKLLLSDNNLKWDGTFDQNEIKIIEEIFLSNDFIKSPELGVNTNRSKLIDYSPQYEFNYDKFVFIENPEDYKRIVTRDHDDFYRYYRPRVLEYSMKCLSLLQQHEVMFNWQGDKDQTVANKVQRCAGATVFSMTYFHAHDEKHEFVTQFFNETLPMWIEEEAFVLKDVRDEFGFQLDIPNDNMRYGIFYMYYVFGEWAGVRSKELDEKMLAYWEKTEEYNTSSVWARDVDKCVIMNDENPQHPNFSEIYIRGTRDGSHGLCDNGAARYAYHLAMTGLYYKNSDYINEAIWVATNIAGGASENGSTVDSLRGGQAPVYMAKTAGNLDGVADLLNYYLGLNIRDNAHPKTNVTIQTVIERGLEVWLNPEINYNYAKLNQMHRKVDDVQGQETEGGESIVKLRAKWVHQFIGDWAWNNPELDEYRKLDFVMPIGVRRQALKKSRIMLQSSKK